MVDAHASWPRVAVQILREDKLRDGVTELIRSHLGPAFVNNRAASMTDVYSDMDAKTPCIFVLSQARGKPTTRRVWRGSHVCAAVWRCRVLTRSAFSSGSLRRRGTGTASRASRWVRDRAPRYASSH